MPSNTRRYSVEEWNALDDCCQMADTHPLPSQHRTDHSSSGLVRSTQVDWIYQEDFYLCTPCNIYHSIASDTYDVNSTQWEALPTRAALSVPPVVPIYDELIMSDRQSAREVLGLGITANEQWNISCASADTAAPIDTSKEDRVVNIDDIVLEFIQKYNNQVAPSSRLKYTVKVRAAVKRAYKTYIRSLTASEKFLNCGYMSLEPTDDGFKLVKSINYGVILDSYTIFGANRIPYTIAIQAIKEALPSWVVVRKRGRYVSVSTDKSECHKSVLYNFIGHNILSIPSSGLISCSSMEGALYDIVRFRKSYAKNMLSEMRANASAQEKKLQKEVRSGLGDLDAFLRKIRKDRKVSEFILQQFPIPGHGLKSSRNWGIEVETAGARGVNTPRGWDSKYDGSLNSAYDYEEPESCELDHTEHRWTGMFTGTVQSAYEPNPNYCGTTRDECEVCVIYYAWEEGDSGSDCKEFVSPILHSYHSKGLEALVKEIATQPQNDSAGIHVHVDVADLTAKQIGSLAYGYNVIEPILEASYQRTTREYCNPREAEDLSYIGRQTKKNPNMRTRDIRSETRYTALNLEAIRSHGTVEFRAMGPVYDYEYLIRWAYLCRELVNVAKAGVKPREWNAIDSFDKLHKLFISRGAESANTMSTLTVEDFESMAQKNSDVDIYVAENEFALMNGEI